MSGLIVMPEYIRCDYMTVLTIMANTPAGSSDNDGEYFSMAVAVRKAAVDVHESDIVIVPLSGPIGKEPADFTFLAKTPLMFIKLVGPPQPIETYGKCVAYHGDVPDIPFALESLLEFPSLSHYIVARPGVFEALGEIVPAPADLDDRPAKKLCVRMQDKKGQVEQGDVDQGNVEQGKVDQGNIEEGKVKQKKIEQNKALEWEYPYSKYYLIDLDGTKYPTRSKENLIEREKDFWFLFRALDMNRRFAISMMDHYELDIQRYRGYVEYEGSTVDQKRRNDAFATSRYYNRVHTTALFTDPAKLKLFLTGNVKIGGVLPNFQLEDFVPKVLMEIVTDVYAWPFHNTPSLTILRCLETVFRVLLSEE